MRVSASVRVRVVRVTLTVITYKVSLSNLLPAITDLTVLDKHQLLCFFIILAIVFETALLGSVMDCGLEVRARLTVEVRVRVRVSVRVRACSAA